MFYYPSGASGDSGDQSMCTSACVPDPAAGVLSSPASEFLDDDRAAAARARPYTAEERRERVERYRSKRNHRNFRKKITYACRKTLADRRPRVRGRFARNGETETEAESSKISSSNGDDRRPQMQHAADGKQEFGYDEDIWTYLDNMFSANFL